MADSEQGEYYEVVQGENLTLIALRYGFADHKPIYDHPNNADFKSKRPNPDILHPGDRIFIPPVSLREESRPTEKCHWFVLKWPTKVLRITLEDSDGKHLADAPYELTVYPPPSDWSFRVTYKGRLYAQEKIFRGKTDSDGLLEHPVPVNAARARLKVGSSSWNLALGHLNPPDPKNTPDKGITGIQARLKNLGFYSGEIDGIFGPRTKQAIGAFKAKHQPEKTKEQGDIDSSETETLSEETLSMLKDKHKC